MLDSSKDLIIMNTFKKQKEIMIEEIKKPKDCVSSKEDTYKETEMIEPSEGTEEVVQRAGAHALHLARSPGFDP